MSNPLYVIAVDGTENSARALDFACQLAKQTGASLMLAHVINWSGFQPVSALEMVKRPVDKKTQEKFTRDKILAPALATAEGQSVKAGTWYNWGHPAKQIQKMANDKGAAMIIMGKSGHGTIAELVLGSISNSLVHHSNLPVVLVP